MDEVKFIGVNMSVLPATCAARVRDALFSLYWAAEAVREERWDRAGSLVGDARRSLEESGRYCGFGLLTPRVGELFDEIDRMLGNRDPRARWMINEVSEEVNTALAGQSERELTEGREQGGPAHRGERERDILRRAGYRV